jgi:serine/threonine protein kinase
LQIELQVPLCFSVYGQVPNMTPPTVLNHRYRVVRVLASGGFGDTFLAEDSFLPSKRLCVIKQLKLLSDNPQVYEIVQSRFQREAAILEELGRASSQIPELYAYFEESGRFYLVQEWIEGQTLASKVRHEGVLSEFAVKQLLEKTLPVLGHIHDRGIIHRDIKPDNVILRRNDGLPVLIDFGAVKESVGTMVNSQGQTVSSIVIGTPGYMPPEQGVGRPLFSSDLYSLGLTCIYLLTGKQPQDLPTNHRTGEFAAWQTYAPTVSDQLTEILDRTIRYHPRDRFVTAQDMLDALQATMATSTVLTPVVMVAPASVTVTPMPPPVSVPPTYPDLSPSVPPVVEASGSLPSTPPTSLVSPPVPPTQVRPSSDRSSDRSSRSLIAAGITATLVVATTGGLYYYLQQVRPQQEAQAKLEELEMFQSQGDYQACLSAARSLQSTIQGSFSEDLRAQVTSIAANCASAQDQATLQAAVNIASQANPNWQQAIDKAKQIPETSAIYADAEKFINGWQKNALQDYLRVEGPKLSEQLADVVTELQPTVENVAADQVVINYDSSTNPRRATEAGIKTYTLIFMQLIAGDNKDTHADYKDFDELVVYPRGKNQQGSLTVDAWQTYLKAVASTPQNRTQLLENLQNQVQIQNR